MNGGQCNKKVKFNLKCNTIVYFNIIDIPSKFCSNYKFNNECL